MKTESCREWRESLGAYALGQLPEGERAALEAHLVAPHMGPYRAKVKPIVVGTQLQILEPA